MHIIELTENMQNFGGKVKNKFLNLKYSILFLVILFSVTEAGQASSNQTEVDTPLFVAALRVKKFSELENLFNELRIKNQESKGGVPLFSRSFDSLSQEISKDAVLLEALNEWCKTNQASYLAYLNRGIYYRNLAWQGRGEQYFHKLSTEQKGVFQERLPMAEADLKKASEINPKSAEAWSRLIEIAAIKGDRKTAQMYFDKAMELDNSYFPAYFNYWYFVTTPKWGGSSEEMLSFARQSVASHLTEPRFNLLISRSYMEIKQTVLKASFSDIAQYFHQEKVWNEIKDAHESYLFKYPKAIIARNYYAYFAYLAGQNKIAFDQFQIIGGNWEKSVWVMSNYFEDALAWVSGQLAQGNLSDPLT